MSLRTIVELNHDFVHQIIESQEEFCHLLIRALNSGNDDKAWGKLRRFGVIKALVAHHSDDRRVVTRYEEVDL